MDHGLGRGRGQTSGPRVPHTTSHHKRLRDEAEALAAAPASPPPAQVEPLHEDAEVEPPHEDALVDPAVEVAKQELVPFASRMLSLQQDPLFP